MVDFSIELAAESIPDRRTRSYFHEVVSSFISGNNRSALVMLWTVVVCDLVYKLQDLRDTYGDRIAKEILEDIEIQQAKDPRSSVWESKLLDSVCKRTALLDTSEHTHLQQIQELRHLCAHPVLRSVDVLYSPNRETTRACIRNAMEVVLLKPPVFTKGVVEALVLDLEEKKDLLLDDSSLEKYLKARYLQQGTPGAIEDNMFQRLWILSFKAQDVRADGNREINMRALAVLFRHRPHEIKAHVEANVDRFSTIGTGPKLEALVRFLGTFPVLYAPLTAAATVPIQNVAQNNPDLLASAWFLSAHPKQHVEQLLQRLKDDYEVAMATFKKSPELNRTTWTAFVNTAAELGVLQEALRCGVWQYSKSRSFDQADERFSKYIEPYFDQYDSDTLIQFLEGVESNNQTYLRSRAEVDHGSMQQVCVTVLGTAFDAVKFPRFIESIS